MSVTTEIKPPMAAAVAVAFCQVLKEWLTAAQFKNLQSNTRKQLRDAPDSGCCYSHDDCDANVAMMDAFEKCGFNCDQNMERSPWVMNREDVQAVWNEAWTLAKKSCFTLADEGVKCG